MHPQYKSDKPGIAPDCGMKLVPVYADEAVPRETACARHRRDYRREAATDRRDLRHGRIRNHARLRPRRRARDASTKRASPRCSPSSKAGSTTSSSTSPARPSAQGDPLLTVYSPEALATQQEYLLALKAQHTMHDNPLHEIKESTDNLVAAARKRLELWDIGDRPDRRDRRAPARPSRTSLWIRPSRAS